MVESLLTPGEAAEILKVSPWTLRRWAQRGEVPFLRVGGQLRFRSADLSAWLETRRRGLQVEGVAGHE